VKVWFPQHFMDVSGSGNESRTNNLAGSVDTIQTHGHFTLDGRTHSHFIQLDADKLEQVAVQMVFLPHPGNM
jgi:hypothetical protein